MLYEGSIHFEYKFCFDLVFVFNYEVVPDCDDYGNYFPVMGEVELVTVYLRKDGKQRKINLPPSLDLEDVVKYIKEHYNDIEKDLDEEYERTLDFSF